MSGSNELSSSESPSEIIYIDDPPAGNRPNRQGIGGAKRKSKVWDYFIDDPNNVGKCVCQIKTTGGQKCGKSITRNTANLENHIRYIHPTYFSPIEEAKKQRKEAARSNIGSTSAEKQLTLEDSIRRPRLALHERYSSGHPKQVAFSHSLSLLLASTSMPYQIVEDPLFQDCIYNADPKLVLPSRQALSKAVRSLDDQIKSAIKSVLENTTQLISLSADIWSRRGFTSSYLGVTAHFFDGKKNLPQCVLLAMPKFENRHTAGNILGLLQEVLSTYGLSVDDKKIFHIVTDNGSNIKKALEEVEQLFDTETPNEDEEPAPPGNVDPAIYDTNIEAEDHEVDDEVMEYEAEEAAHFSALGYHKRLACIDHSLTCSVRNVIDKNPLVHRLKMAAFKLIRTMNSSGIAVEFLMKRTGKKPLLPPSHRWVYTYYALERLLLLRDAITELSDQHEKVEECLLSGLQWRQATALMNLLKPIANFVRYLEGEAYVTISRVLPALLDIEAFLEEDERITGFNSVARELKAEIRSRFRCILDSTDSHFQPIYAVATLLDMKFTKILDLQEYTSLKNAAITHLKQLVHTFSTGAHPEQAPFGTSTETQMQDQQTPGGGELFSRLFLRLERASQDAPPERSRPTDLEVDEFLQCRSHATFPDASSSPLEFWISKSCAYPMLHKTAIDILCTPATSAAAERVFSQAGLCASALRARLSHKNLEAEVMVRVNRHLL